jgi:hypothetical protein
MANDVNVEIGLDSTAFQKEMDKMAKSVSALGDSINQNFNGKVNSALNTFKGTLGGLIAFRGLEIIADQFRKLGEEISKAIDVAQKKEQGLTRLNFALQISGRGASQTTKEFSDFADQMESTTKFTDDQAIASLTLLANTTNLSNKGIKEATKAAADLATVMGVDLESATSSLAKAQQGHLDRLLKNTLHVREGNNASETWANTLARLATLQGSAGSTLETYSGKTDQLAKSQENVSEALGNIIIKNSQVLGFLGALKDQFDQNEKGIIDNSNSMSENLSDVILYVLSFSKVVIDLADIFGRAFSVILNTVTGTVKGITVAFNTLISAIALPLKGLAMLSDSVLGTDMAGAFTDFEKNTANMAVSTIQDFKSIGEAISGETYLSKMSSNLDKMAVATAEFRGKEKKETKTSDEEKVQSAYATDRAILESRSKLVADITSLNQQLLIEQSAYLASLDAINTTDASERAVKELQVVFDSEQAKIQATEDAEIAKTSFIKDSQEKKLTQDKVHYDAALKQQQNADKFSLALQDLKNKKKIEDETLALSTFATLSNSKHKELAMIGKAAAITQIAIQTPKAMASSFAFGSEIGGPILGFVFEGIAAIAMASQAAAVAGVAFANGGIVGGNSFSGDNIQARVNSGEMVLNAQQQANLFATANGKGNSNGGFDASMLSSIVSAIRSTPIIVQANGREIARLVREESRSGFSFA